jgi:hypothetical protein
LTKERQSGMEQRTKSKSSQEHNHAPVLRLRELVVGIVCIAFLIVWPLFMVSKQIFITNLSMRESALADSLSLAGRELAALRLYNEKLSSTARIETITREHCGLEYPVAGQIIVIRENRNNTGDWKKGMGFFTFLKKPFFHGRG